MEVVPSVVLKWLGDIWHIVGNQDLLSSLKKVRAIKRRVVRSKRAFISEIDPLTAEIDEIADEIRKLDGPTS
jgi:hypothetical protein